jgi:hypothetical protein
MPRDEGKKLQPHLKDNEQKHNFVGLAADNGYAAEVAEESGIPLNL